LDKKQLKHFEQKIKQEQDRYSRIVSDLDVGLDKSLSDSVEELSTYDQHPADVASEVFERSKDFALREDALFKLQAIKHALQRLKDGTYGICEACGKQIPYERLEAVPDTTQCVDCRAGAEEAVPRINVRPVEEDILEPPFARDYNDATGKNEYDAEDTWQELAKWQEHAPHAGAGAYYGSGDGDEEPIGYTELVDHIPYVVGDDGTFYESTKGIDDESPPAEQIDVGLDNQNSKF